MNNKRHYIISGVVLVATIATYFFVSKPLQEEATNLQVEEQQLQTQITGLQNQLSKLKDFQVKLDSSSEVQKRQSNEAIPVNYNQDLLITALSQTADDNNMNLSSISFSEGSESEFGVSSATIVANLEGNYQNLIAFLRSIENEIQRKIVIRSINVNLGPSLGALQEINFTLNMETYYQ